MSIKVYFEEPEHGWMKVVVESNDFRIEEHVSDVPADSLRMLIDAILDMLEGREESSVTWFLEPHEMSWKFQSVGEDIRVSLCRTHSKTDIVVVDSQEGVCKTIWRALRKLESLDCWSNDSEMTQWSHPFPHSSLDALTRKCREAENFGVQ